MTTHVRQITPLRRCGSVLCVPPRQYPIDQTREYRASLDLDPPPVTMCLPQVINALVSLQDYLTVSFNTYRPSVSFILFIAPGGKLIAMNSVDAAGLWLRTSTRPFPSELRGLRHHTVGRGCSGVVLPRVFRNHVYSGYLRTIFPYRNNLNYPLPVLTSFAGKSLDMHMEHKIPSVIP